MRKKRNAELPEAVPLLRKRIEAWRQTRKKVSPMPAPLWAAATSLAAEHGVCRIARAVGIDYAALKRRMNSAEEVPKRGFIELPAAAFAASHGEAVFELSDDTGATMTFRMSGRVDVDVIAVSNAFWNRRG